MDAVFFCIHCAERFCSQECFRHHVADHASVSERFLQTSHLMADRVMSYPAVRGEGRLPSMRL
jgi:hypothetical protein